MTMTSGKPLEWTDDMLIGHGKIDETHREFIDLANELLGSTLENSLNCLERLEAHVLSHFALEKTEMEDTEFPAGECHIEEHDKVIHAVSMVRALNFKKEISLKDIHRLAQSLIDWFPGHIVYMDSALAAWVSKIKHEGKPVVIRRKATAA